MVLALNVAEFAGDRHGSAGCRIFFAEAGRYGYEIGRAGLLLDVGARVEAGGALGGVFVFVHHGRDWEYFIERHIRRCSEVVIIVSGQG